MDYTVTLTTEELAALSDSEQIHKDAMRQMRAIRSYSTYDDSFNNFQESLRLKNTLDTVEEEGRTSL
jgi:hypothetical protein